MLVCHCAVVNDHTVREAIATGARDLVDLATECGAGSFCGGCHPALLSLLAEETGVTASAVPSHRPSTVTEQPREPRAVQSVVRAMQEELLATDRPAGTALDPVAEIARRMETTPGTVKRALRVLEHHGFVHPDALGDAATGAPELHAIAEAGVMHLTSAAVDVQELTVARRLVEVETARLAAVRLDDAGDAQLTATLAARHGDDPLSWSADDDLHELLTRITGNPALEILVATATRLARDHSTAALVEGGDPSFGSVVHEGHVRLVDALQSRDPDRAGAAMAAHLHEVMPGMAEPHRVEAHEDPHVVGSPEDATGVARRLALRIARRGLGPNAEIGNDRELARELGVSPRTVVEATALLEYYAVATRPPGPHTPLVVCTPDPWPVAELMALHVHRAGATPIDVHEALRPLELHAVGAAARAIDAVGADRLRRRLDEERQALHRHGLAGDPFSFSVSHNIHPLLAELSGNRVVALFASALHLALIRMGGGAPAGPSVRRTRNAEELVDVHGGIVEAVLARDPDTARERMQAHIDAPRGVTSQSRTPRG